VSPELHTQNIIHIQLRHRMYLFVITPYGSTAHIHKTIYLSTVYILCSMGQVPEIKRFDLI